VPNPKRRRRHYRKSNKKYRRSNPSTKLVRRRHHRRSSNPVAGFSTTELIKLAGGAAVGVVGSKYLSQLALGANNAGAMGAIGQGAATLALAWVANKFAGKDVATGVVAGGGGAILASLLAQYVGAPGAPQSGLGDPLGAALLGDFVPGNIAVPAQWQAFPAPTPMTRKPRT